MTAFTVPEGSVPARLDVFLTRTVPHCSRRRARRVIAAGAVRVNGRRARKGAHVAGGDSVEVADDWLAPPVLRPSPQLTVPILYEDSVLLAVDKPAGMPSHALRGDETGTIANFLLARFPDVATVGKGPLEPGIVHRLDTDTSGVLLVARTPAVYAALRRQFAERRVVKEYRAIVHGEVSRAGEMRAPIAPMCSGARLRVCDAADSRGRPAVTRYRPLQRYGSYTLLAVTISTGVRHQIRVHLAAIGHPIAGDRVYGPVNAGAVAARQLLHAYRLGVTHPESRRHLEITSALPADFTALL